MRFVDPFAELQAAAVAVQGLRAAEARVVALEARAEGLEVELRQVAADVEGAARRVQEWLGAGE